MTHPAFTMSRARKTVAAVVGMTLIAGVPAAQAARRKPVPKPICNLVVDPADFTQSPSLDIRSADVATNRTTLTWVVRVTNLSAPTDATTALGREWNFQFKVGTRDLGMVVSDGPFGTRDASSAGAVVTLDKVKNEVRYSVPLAKINQGYGVTIVPGVTVLREFSAKADGFVQLPQDGLLNPPKTNGDETAVSSRTYQTGKLSCVKPG
jgi:hypothetical protein